jgi:hypothetical protein
VGRKPILDDKREAITVDALICKNRANKGASVGEAVDILEQM